MLVSIGTLFLTVAVANEAHYSVLVSAIVFWKQWYILDMSMLHEGSCFGMQYFGLSFFLTDQFGL